MSLSTHQWTKAEQLDLEIADIAASCYADPLKWARLAFPWGKPGLLAKLNGPCPCQVKVLTVLGDEVKKRRFNGRDAVAPIRIAVSSGHGIGKSILFGIIDNWIKSTRPHSQGTATANTYTQLETKTWAAIQAMAKLSLTAHWFEIGANRIYRKNAKETWFSSPQSCSEENSEAFAGQHAAGSTSYYLNDECSAIADVIFEVQEGGLTDGEPMQFMFGNPTRNNGKFHRVMFGSERDKYICITIDSRDCPLTNKQTIQEWIDETGEDSDFVRVRVKGLPPRASDLQFIDAERVQLAKSRELPDVLPGEPLIMGIDVARGGMDWNVIRFRRGRDARTLPPVRIPGQMTRDTMLFVAKVAEIITERKPDAVFLDSTGIGGPIGDRLRQLGYRVTDVNFGASSPDLKYANQRAYMWGRLKDWLAHGAIDTAHQDKSGRLEMDLTSPLYAHDKNSRVILEPKEKMKDRGLSSPDDADALALTFAHPVAPKRFTREERVTPLSPWS